MFGGLGVPDLSSQAPHPFYPLVIIGSHFASLVLGGLDVPHLSSRAPHPFYPSVN